MEFEGKRVLVTGATRGIGWAIASELVSRGASVVGTGRERSAERASDIRGVLWRDVDFASRDSLGDFLSWLGNQASFDGLVNNAGVNRIKPVTGVSVEDYDAVLETNLRAPFWIAREVIRGMTEAGSEGRIVNVASIWSVITKPHRSLYSAAKTGLVGLTRALAAEWGPSGILVNAVSPGFVLTDMTRQSLSDEQVVELTAQVPLGRMADPRDIAEVVCFLLSPRNRYLTGQNVTVDGGFTIV